MNYVYTPYILPLFAAAFVSIFVAVYGWSRRVIPGARELILMAFGMFVWTVCYAFEVAATRVELKYLWGVIEYFGIVAAPFSWLLFSIVYSGRTDLLTRRFYALALPIPAFTLLMIFTNHWHRLVWTDYQMTPQDNFFLPNISYGLWFWIYTAYSYMVIAAGVILLARVVRGRKGLYRGQILSLLIAVSAPFVGNVLYLSGNSPIPYLDLTPFAFTVSVAALAWAIFGFRLGDVAPMARDFVIEAMREGVVTLDARGRVNDINAAAARMIGVPASQALGRPAREIFAPWLPLLEGFDLSSEFSRKVTVGQGEAKRRYEVRISPLQDSQGRDAGRVVMIRALDENVPTPRFARSAAAPIRTRPVAESLSAAHRAHPESPRPLDFLWNLLVSFYAPPLKSDLPVPLNVNPVWQRAREQILTMVARIAATIGFIALFFAPSGAFALAFTAVLALLFVVGLARDLPYAWRILAFLALLYAAAVNETTHFGFSVESFVFYLSLVLSAAALSTRRGAMHAFLLTMLTMGAFSFLIGSRAFVPWTNNVGYLPEDPASGVSSLMVFAASALALSASVVLLTENLNSAWQKEAQALNLLQQERDLLEQRVQERTRDAREAEEKYRMLVEQLPVAVYRDDADGKGTNNYFSPQVETMFGYPMSDWRKNPGLWREVLHPEDRARALATMKETLERGRSVSEYRILAMNGRSVWVRDEAKLIRDETGKPLFVQGILLDVTEIKKAEEQIRKLSQAVEQSGNTIMITDTLGNIEYVNSQFERSTGYAFAEVKGRNPRFLKSGRQKREFYENLWRTIGSGLIWKGEFLNRRKDGALYWEAATIAPILDSNGAAINYVAVKEDVTEQKILQEQLQKQNDYLSILQQMTLDLLNRRNVKDLLQTVVERAASLLDAPYCELLLLEGEELVVHAVTGNAGKLRGDRTNRETAKATWQAVDTRQPFVLEDYSTWTHRREIYNEFDLRATAAFPILAGEQCLGVLGMGRVEPGYAFTREQIETGVLFARLVALVLDNARLYESAMHELEDRKRAEALLQASEIRFRQIVENASDIIYGTDAEGRFTYVNPAALKLLGGAREEDLIGKSFFDFLAPEFRAEVLESYRRQYAEQIQNAYAEFYVLAGEGQMRCLGQNAQLIRDGERIVGFQAVARDITQLKQAQEALALSRDQALEASRFKSQLLSRVSHELRTPLGGILGYAELLQYKAFGDLSDKQRNAVANIIESTHYLTDVVNDLLDEAQAQSQSLILFERDFNLRELMKRAFSTISVLAERKGLNFRAEISPDLPEELYGDENRLRQIIVNLASNAVKFTRAGEVTIRVSRPAPAQWQIAVSDSGAGIPPEERENIFEPFRQINNAITRENRGSGLGLAITKQLVELMGGQIRLTSEVGKGSEFVVFLPLKNAPKEQK